MTGLVVPAEAKPRRREFLRRDLAGLGLLAVGSLGIGLLVNGLRAHPLPLVYTSPEARLGEFVARLSAPASGAQAATPRRWQTIGLDAFQEIVAAHQGLIIDARPRVFYQAGHVPGAISLPREDFETRYAGARGRLEPEKARPVAIYCSEADCQDSELVADALSRLGYGHLLVYKEGWEEWRRAGLPEETGPPL